MIIDIGKHIKCVFKNGTVIEGIVQEWARDDVRIQSLNDESIMIIMHPDEDIMLIKILPEKPAEEETEEEGREQIREQLDKTVEALGSELDVALKEANLDQLRKMVVEQDKKMIRRRIREHMPSPYMPHKPNYGNQIDMIPPAARRRR